MNVLTVLCFAAATVLAVVAALNVPSPRVSLLSAAVALLALGFTVERIGGLR